MVSSDHLPLIGRFLGETVANCCANICSSDLVDLDATDVRNVLNGENQQMMTRLAITAVRDAFSETVNRVAYRGERIALERHGKTVAALVSADDLKLLQAFEDNWTSTVLKGSAW